MKLYIIGMGDLNAHSPTLDPEGSGWHRPFTSKKNRLQDAVAEYVATLDDGVYTIAAVNNPGELHLVRVTKPHPPLRELPPMKIDVVTQLSPGRFGG